MTTRRRFLVTGVTTPLGRLLSRRLCAVGEVFGVRSPSEPLPTVGQDIASIADLTRSADVREVMAGVVAEANVDTIIHLGLTQVGGEPSGAAGALSARLLLEGAEHSPAVRAFVLCSSALLYRLHDNDPMVVREQHPLDLSPELSFGQRDLLGADVIAGQHMLSAAFRISVLRLAPLVAPRNTGVLADYFGREPCYRAMGFDPIINALSLEDATEALALAAEHAPRGTFNVVGADTLPLSKLAARVGTRCWPVPGALIEALCTLTRRNRHHYRDLRALLHHGLVVDGRAAFGAFGYAPSHPLPDRPNGATP